MASIIALVPIYQDQLKEIENRSLEEFNLKIKQIPKAFIAPKNLDTTWYKVEYPDIPVFVFEQWDKGSLEDYNDLMLTEEFYQRFSEYEFIFLFQTDARFLGTEEQLIEFAGTEYDYYGAPWGDEGMRFVKRVIPGAGHFRILRVLEQEVIAKVGNGGVSLRRVSAMIQFLKKHKKKIAKWEKAEDLFIGYYGAKYPKTIQLPDINTAYRFAMEMNMKEKILAGQKPMAVHKWEKFFPELDEYM